MNEQVQVARSVNLWVWLMTMACTVAAYFVADASTTMQGRSLAVASLAAAKFVLVAMIFMELRTAHILWRVLAAVYIVIFFVVFLIV